MLGQCMPCAVPDASLRGVARQAYKKISDVTLQFRQKFPSRAYPHFSAAAPRLPARQPLTPNPLAKCLRMTLALTAHASPSRSPSHLTLFHHPERESTPASSFLRRPTATRFPSALGPSPSFAMFAIARASAASSKAGLARSNTALTPRFFYAAAATSASPAFVLGLRPVLRPYSTQTSTTTTTTTTTTTPPVNEKAGPASDAAKAAAAAANPTAETKEVTPEVKETGVAAAKKEKPSGPLMKRAWAVIKKEAAHYWAGTKLLGSEIKISSKLQWKVLNGGSLTRRERRQVSLLALDSR